MICKKYSEVRSRLVTALLLRFARDQWARSLYCHCVLVLNLALTITYSLKPNPDLNPNPNPDLNLGG